MVIKVELVKEDIGFILLVKMNCMQFRGFLKVDFVILGEKLLFIVLVIFFFYDKIFLVMFDKLQ